MAPRREVLAGDDALDTTALSSGTVPAPDGGQPPPDDGFTDEERAQFEEMRAGSSDGSALAPAGEDGGEEDRSAGLTSRDVQADADAAAAAAALKDPGAKTPPQGAPQGQQQPTGDDEDDEDDVDPTKGGKFPQRVNYNKFVRSRERATKAENEARELREKLARTDERFKVLAEALQAPDPKQAPQQQAGDEELGPMPDPEKDIFAYAAWQTKFNAQLAQTVEQLQNGFVANNEDAQLRTSYANDIRTFSTEQPDFPKAYEHMMAVRVADLAMQSYGINLFDEGAQLTPQQLQAISNVVEREERQLAAAAIKNRRSPAQQLYVMAMARGYRPAQQQQQQQQNGGGALAARSGVPAAKPNGQAAPQQSSAAKPRSAVSEAVAAARRGVETNASLSSGGGAPEGELTREQLMSMGDEEFNQFMNTASKEQIRNVLGH